MTECHFCTLARIYIFPFHAFDELFSVSLCLLFEHWCKYTQLYMVLRQTAHKLQILAWDSIVFRHFAE